MSSQLVGVAAAVVSDGNVQQGATIARDATNYNYLLHHEVVEMLDEQAKCSSDSCRDAVREKYATLDEQRNKDLSSLCQKNISACNEISAQLQADEPKIRELAEQLRRKGDIGAAVNVGWIIAENNQAAQNTITTEVVVQRDGDEAGFWSLAAQTLAGAVGAVKPGGGGAKATGASLDNVASSIHAGQQGKHILGHNNFIPGRSYFNEGVDPQKLLNGTHAGEFPVVGYGSRGQPIVDFGTNIGVDGSSGLATRYGTIHSGKSGAHIVPTNPSTVGVKP